MVHCSFNGQPVANLQQVAQWVVQASAAQGPPQGAASTCNETAADAAAGSTAADHAAVCSPDPPLVRLKFSDGFLMVLDAGTIAQDTMDALSQVRAHLLSGQRASAAAAVLPALCQALCVLKRSLRTETWLAVGFWQQPLTCCCSPSHTHPRWLLKPPL